MLDVDPFRGQDRIDVGDDDATRAEEVPQVRDGPLGRVLC